MSGFEVVGVVLGAFPLLVGAAKKWMEGVEALVEWKRFRPRFISFLGAIDVENTIFRNTLLNVMITATASMSMDVDYLEWKNPDLGKALENPDVVKALVLHLGDAYNGFIRTMTTIQCAIEGLHDLLTCEDGNADWADPKISQWQYRLKSFQFSFSSEGEGLKSILEDENKRLQRLLASNAQVTIVRVSASSSKSAWARFFRIVRDQSLSLHAALEKAWTCDCRASHRSQLQLDTTYTETKAPSFGMVIEIEAEHEPMQGRRQRTLLQNSLVIGTRQETKKGSPNSHLAGPSMISLSSDVSRLTCDLKSGQLLSSQKPKKLQKKARFADTFSPGLQPSPSQSRTPSPSPSPSRSLIPQNSGAEEKRLHNLCTELRSTQAIGFCAGYMVGNEGQRHYLTIKTRQEINILPPRTISLEDLLMKNGGLEFPREMRYNVASLLASSLLHLYTTPWMTRLDKRNIVFPRNGLDIATDRPCIVHSFKKAAPKPPATTQQSGASQNTGGDSEKVKEALISLGILFLELRYGEMIEQQPFRQKYLRRDGRVGRLTDLKTAREWSQDLSNEEPDLENVVLCCINYSFPQKADWNDVEFRQAVYDNIIKPVEDLARAWTL